MDNSTLTEMATRHRLIAELSSILTSLEGEFSKIPNLLRKKTDSSPEEEQALKKLEEELVEFEKVMDDVRLRGKVSPRDLVLPYENEYVQWRLSQLDQGAKYLIQMVSIMDAVGEAFDVIYFLRKANLPWNVTQEELVTKFRKVCAKYSALLLIYPVLKTTSRFKQQGLLDAYKQVSETDFNVEALSDLFNVSRASSQWAERLLVAYGYSGETVQNMMDSGLFAQLRVCFRKLAVITLADSKLIAVLNS